MYRTLFLLAAAISLGCTPEVEPILCDTQEDSSHEHRHQHSCEDDHEHEHSGFEGAHEHRHYHGHRHGEPLFDGEIVAIQHAHHKRDQVHYHAEVLQQASEIVIYLLKEDNDGKPEAVEVRNDAVAGLSLVPRPGQKLSADFRFDSLGKIPLKATATGGLRGVLPAELDLQRGIQIHVHGLRDENEELGFIYELRTDSSNTSSDDSQG